MGRVLVSLLLICPNRYGKILGSQPLPEPKPIYTGMYKYIWGITLHLLRPSAVLMLDPVLVMFLSFSPFLSLSLSLYFFYI